MLRKRIVLCWQACWPLLENAALPHSLFVWGGGSSETISLRAATSNSNGISSTVQMKAFLILCQFSQDLQKQAHSFSFCFLASQELCACSLLLEEQLCCAVSKMLSKIGEKTPVGIRQKGNKYEPQQRET